MFSSVKTHVIWSYMIYREGSPFMLTQVFNRCGHCMLYVLSALVMRQALHPCWKLLWLICESLLLCLLCAVDDFERRTLLEVPHQPYALNRWYTDDIQIISNQSFPELVSVGGNKWKWQSWSLDVPFPEPWALVQAAQALQARLLLRSRPVSISAGAMSVTVNCATNKRRERATDSLNKCATVFHYLRLS